MHQRNPGQRRLPGQTGRRQSIDPPGLLDFGFCLVDRRIGGGVDDGRPGTGGQNARESLRLQKIQCVPAQPHKAEAGVRGERQKRPADLPGSAGDQHISHGCFNPSRSPEYWRARMARHQASFSRNHATVFVRPVSKVSVWDQPNSVSMRLQSIA